MPRKIFPFILLLLSVLFIAQEVNAFPKRKIDSIATEFLVSSGASCIVIGIVDGKKTRIYCYGRTSRQGKHSADAHTIFEIGSITKLFTGIATAAEVNENKLKYTDKLSQFFGGAKVPSYFGNEIKVIDLLHNTSGLPGNPSNLESAKGYKGDNPFATYKESDLYQFLSQYALKRKPGTIYTYSNTGFGILGYILSKVSGNPYENVIRQEICDPLGMKNTVIKLSEHEQKKMAVPYKSDGLITSNYDFGILQGAGAIRSDLTDMLKFLKAAMNPEKIKDKNLSQAMKTSEDMLFNYDNGRAVGLGWEESALFDNRIMGHNGQTGGYKSFLDFIKGQPKGIVILSNSNKNLDLIGIRILEILRKN